MKRPGAKVEKVYYESEPVNFRKSIVGHSVERQTTCGYIQLLAKVRYGSRADLKLFLLHKGHPWILQTRIHRQS